MKLTQKAVDYIRYKDNGIRLKLAATLRFTENWIISLAHKNKVNGPLTTRAAINLIQQETGWDESQILEEAAT